MKRVKWYQWILITIVILFIIVAFISATETCPQCQVCKPIIKGVPITKEVEIIKEVSINQNEIDKLKKRISIQKQIMDVDNKGFTKASEISNVLTESLLSVYNHDEYGMTRSTEKIEKITKELNLLINQKIKLQLQLNEI